MPGAAGEPALVIAASARRLRRAVGLTAWAALEELVVDAVPLPLGGLGAQASARALAARLGVSKDTAAGALRRLASVGLLRREDHRDAARGVFARSVYVIDVARLDESGIRRHATQPARSRRRGAVGIPAARADGQASLFDLAALEEQ